MDELLDAVEEVERNERLARLQCGEKYAPLDEDADQSNKTMSEKSLYIDKSIKCEDVLEEISSSTDQEIRMLLSTF